jgi:hypothetical protein
MAYAEEVDDIRKSAVIAVKSVKNANKVVERA